MEFRRIEAILKKLNQKLSKIKEKAHGLIILLITSKVDDTISAGKIEYEIELLKNIIDKYLESVEEVSPEEEIQLCKDCVAFEEQKIIETFDGQLIEWIKINILK